VGGPTDEPQAIFDHARREIQGHPQRSMLIIMELSLTYDIPDVVAGYTDIRCQLLQKYAYPFSSPTELADSSLDLPNFML